MPLPRYSPPGARAITGASAIASQAKAQTWQTLSSTLDQWSSTLYKQGAALRTQEGREQAAIDVAKTGKYEEVGDFTIYDKAYKDAAHTAFSVHTELDAKNYADFAENRIDLDETIIDKPKAFIEQYEKYTNTTLADAPDEYAQAIAKTALDKYGVSKFNKMNGIHSAKIFNRNKLTYEDGIKLAEQNFFQAQADGNEEEMNRNLHILSSLHISAENNLYTNRNSVELQMKKFGEKVYKEQAIIGFNDSEDRVAYIDDFRKTSKLTDEETQKTIDRFHKNLENETKDKKRVSELEDAEDEKFKKDSKKDIYKRLLNNTLTQEQLNEAVGAGVIETKEYDDLNARIQTVGVAKSDDKAYNYYMKNMESTSFTDILTDGSLSRPDKDRLIARFEKLQKQTEDEAEEAMDWEGTRQGKQAISEIKLKFKVFDDMIMQKTDFDNDILRDYAMLRRSLFDEVNGLALDERTTGSLITARRLLKDYEAGEIVGTEPYQEKIEEDAQAKRDAKVKTDAKAKEKADAVSGGNAFSRFINF